VMFQSFSLNKESLYLFTWLWWYFVWVFCSLIIFVCVDLKGIIYVRLRYSCTTAHSNGMLDLNFDVSREERGQGGHINANTALSVTQDNKSFNLDFIFVFQILVWVQFKTLRCIQQQKLFSLSIHKNCIACRCILGTV